MQSSRELTATHVLLVALDARGGDDAGLPDTLLLMDLDTGERQSIPRDWTMSRIEPEQMLVQKYLEMPGCEPFCSIQGVYAFGGALIQDEKGLYQGLELLRDVIQVEYEIESLGIVVIDLAWAKSFLVAVAPLELTIQAPIPIGGRSMNGSYTDVDSYVPVGTWALNGEELFWYARARHGSSNEDRMVRQEDLLQHLLEQKHPAELSLAALSSQGQLMTDLSLSEVMSSFIAEFG